jgi:hypothetical protein
MENQQTEPKKKSGCLKGCLISAGIIILLIIILINLLIFKGKDIAMFALDKYDGRISGELAEMELPPGFKKTFTPFLFIGMQSDVSAIAFEGKDENGNAMKYFEDYFTSRGWTVQNYQEDSTPKEGEYEDFKIITMERDNDYIFLFSWNAGDNRVVNLVKGPRDKIEGQIKYN